MENGLSASVTFSYHSTGLTPLPLFPPSRLFPHPHSPVPRFPVPSYTRRRVMPMNKTIRWRWGLIAALAMMLLSLFPQLHLCWERGAQWHGSQAFFYTDESAYAAYVNALIDGRPRRNDPYSGRDDTPDSPLPESLFSIQFIPAYLVALPARALGLSTAKAFILITPLVAFTTALALFWILALITNEDRAAAALVPFVLCLALLASGNGVLRPIFGQQATLVYLPFLRRYSPAVAFPCFLLFFCLVWQVLMHPARKWRLAYLIGAAATFLFCVYSYFYLWTAALAWIILVGFLWFIARPDDWRNGLRRIGLILAIVLAASAPYAILLSRRAPTMDAAQALVRTHAPDPWRVTEAIALILVLGLIFALFRRRVSGHDPRILFTLTFALLPFVLYNQQIITGRSLQPMHYEQFITPYSALLALALMILLLPRRKVEQGFSRAALLLTLGLFGYLWGMGETWIATRRFAQVNVRRDEAHAASLRLRELAKPPANSQQDPREVVFANIVARGDNLPTTAPQALLWAPHMFVFSGVSLAENKERLFKFLYYSGVRAEDFTRYYKTYGFMEYAVFGWERANAKLAANYKPISDDEIAIEAKNYFAFAANFDATRATRPTLSYLLVEANHDLDFSNLDRWYVRDNGERIGKHLLYRLTLRNST